MQFYTLVDTLTDYFIFFMCLSLWECENADICQCGTFVYEFFMCSFSLFLVSNFMNEKFDEKLMLYLNIILLKIYFFLKVFLKNNFLIFKKKLKTDASNLISRKYLIFFLWFFNLEGGIFETQLSPSCLYPWVKNKTKLHYIYDCVTFEAVIS